MDTLFLILLLAFVLYFTPFFISELRHHKNQAAIFVLNLLLGWTLLGWVIALVWAFCDTTDSNSYSEEKTSVADELERFASLKEQGVITEDEFNAKKSKLLDL